MNENAASRASAMRWPGGRSRDRAALGCAARASSPANVRSAAAVDMRLDKIGDCFEPRVERLRLAGLHQAEMAFGQRDLFVARQRADDRNPQGLDRLDDEPAMALAADAINNDAGDAEPARS